MKPCPHIRMPGEEKWFTVPAEYTGDGEEDPVINVYSDVPGVRPART